MMSIDDPVAEQISALHDADWTVREDAAACLGRLKDPRAIGPLISTLRDTDRSVRDAAIGALKSIGTPAVKALGPCLTDCNLTVQEGAAAVLASIADDTVLDQLMQATQNPNWIVRMHVAKALRRIKNPQSIRSLVPLLQDHVKAVREEASSALEAIGDLAIPLLLQSLSHQDWLVRLHAVESLAKTRSPDAVAPLVATVFNDKDFAVREDAVRALGAIGDPRAVGALETVITTTPELRTAAVEALGRIGDRRAVPILIAVVKRTIPPALRMRIEDCGDQGAEERATQAAAVRALGMIGDDSSLPALVSALESTFTRTEAAEALGRFGSRAIPWLLPFLRGSQDDHLRHCVKEILASTGWRGNRAEVR